MITLRERNGRWQYSIHFKWPDGTKFREQRNSPVAGKSGSQRYAEERERFLLRQGKEASATSEVPSLKDFFPRVMKEHYKALRRKPATQKNAQDTFRDHLKILHDRPLDRITKADISAIKSTMSKLKPKTVNNVLSVLGVALKCAVEWDVLVVPPCKIQLLPITNEEMGFYELDEFRSIVESARELGPMYLSTVLLGGSAGLRAGEIRALKWGDFDMRRGFVTVARAFWKNVEGPTKGGRPRRLDLTRDLKDALISYGVGKADDRVFPGDVDSDHISESTLRTRMGHVEKGAGYARTGKRWKGRVHILRHTFCSHLAMAGVPAKAIQELAGHVDLKTTLRYMHLSPQNKSDAISTLSSFHGLTKTKSMPSSEYANGSKQGG